VLLDLGGQLARGREDEGSGRPPGLAREAVEDREDEGGGLAAAGHRAGENVTALKSGGDGLELDRRRAREAELVDAAEEVGVEAERGEGHGIVRFLIDRRVGENGGLPGSRRLRGSLMERERPSVYHIGRSEGAHDRPDGRARPLGRGAHLMG
jgi:hypothetical protein